MPFSYVYKVYFKKIRLRRFKKEASSLMHNYIFVIFCQSPKSRFTCWLSIYLFLLVWVQSRPNQKFSNIKKTLLSAFSTQCPSHAPRSNSHLPLWMPLLTLKNHAPPRHFQSLAAMFTKIPLNSQKFPVFDDEMMFCNRM